ncbi:hypothetical protein NDA14_003013 [Ustilago hordei]|nr:hypothetical protein NDA14_003013 [Ustilago hordei]UTT90075.1 hypothetical protein NDA17_004683 [Ustilago hordei]
MHHLLPDETILRILSHLDAPHLARLQLVSSQLRTLAKDRHLWKRLFYFRFVQPAESSTSSTLPTLRELRSLLLHQNLPSRKHVAADGSRRIHRLPSRFYATSHSSHSTAEAIEQAVHPLDFLFSNRADVEDRVNDHLLDWEQLYRVSTNWHAGNFAVSQLQPPARARDYTPPTSLHKPPATASQQTIARVSESFIFTAPPSSQNGARTLPCISVYPSEPSPVHHPHSDQDTQYVPKDLHKRAPLASFSSPSLQRLLSERPSDAALANAHVTEIAVDAVSVTDLAARTSSSDRKRKTPADLAGSPQQTTRVLVAFSTGHISLFALHRTTKDGKATIEATEEISYRPTTYTSGQHVTMAALHSPALVLCSSTFDVSFYQLSISLSAKTQLNLVQRMTSYRPSWPAALRLKKLPFHDVNKRHCRSSSSMSPQRRYHADLKEEAAFRVTLAYSKPSYPSSCNVSVQELVVRLDLASSTATPAGLTSRHATAKHPFRSTPLDLRGRSMLAAHHGASSAAGAFAVPTSLTNASSGDEANHADHACPSAKRSRTTSLTYDDPFVVVGASDNLLEVYELLGATTYVRRDLDCTPTSSHRSATATPVSPRDSLRLVHRRSLHGHTGSVHSVALEDGRCVSASADGSIMVWSLGDRSNETESVASMMPFAPQTHADLSGTTGARSASSTIAQEQDDEEAAKHMTHVLTLRTPVEFDSADGRIHTSQATSRNGRPLGPSLGQLVRSRVLDRQARGVIRWVSTAFDKIVSIVAYTDAHARSSLSIVDPQYAREQVQVWSFG